MTTKGKRIAIIGAGPGGIAAGIALHQAGFEVKIFERHATVTPLGGAIILNAIGIVILRKLGANVDDIFAANEPLFKRYDGKIRAKFALDKALLDRAGVNGWQSGMMRSELYERMLRVLPEGLIVPNHGFTHFVEHEGGVTVHFDNGQTYEADLVIGADGVQSQVRKQLYNDGDPIHLGIAVWLGWCELAEADRSNIILQHNHTYQFGFAPLIYKGKDCFEWWFVEPCAENQEKPADVMQYIQKRLRDFAEPTQRILAHTDPHHQLFRWVVKYKKPLKQWSKGRATLMGDAAHPTSPYAAYGAGMSIEDAFFLAKFLKERDLSDKASLAQGLAQYDKQRVAYTNHVTAFARALGRIYHGLPLPLARLRDLFLDNSSIPGKQISNSYTQEAQELLQAVLEDGKSVAEPI